LISIKNGLVVDQEPKKPLMSDEQYIDKLSMPQSAMADLARAVPICQAIVGDHYRHRAARLPS
jgi:hypothetical protein